MRLRNLKNKDIIIEECEFLIRNPEEYKGNYKNLFPNRAISLLVDMAII